MALKTPQEYLDSLRKLNLEVYLLGERVKDPVDNPIIRPSLNSVIMTYELAQDPKYADLMVVNSHLTGEKINNPNTHGTGCTLSSAIASNLALEYSIEESVTRAKVYITGALKANLNLGHGSGPLDHCWNINQTLK